VPLKHIHPQVHSKGLTAAVVQQPRQSQQPCNSLNACPSVVVCQLLQLRLHQVEAMGASMVLLLFLPLQLETPYQIRLRRRLLGRSVETVLETELH